MQPENQPDDAIPRPGFAIDLEALQRDLKYELVETLDHVARSRDTPHQGMGRSREEALAELRRLAPDAQDVRCSRVRIRIPRRPRPQESDENRERVTQEPQALLRFQPGPQGSGAAISSRRVLYWAQTCRRAPTHLGC